MQENGQEYIAFISYRHKPLDRRTAEWVEKQIEHFIVPKELRKDGKKLGRVFRDEDELPLSSDLSESILYALDHSEFLIVICTPDLPLSQWCEQEIRYFRETHDRDHVLAVLADGSPGTSFSPLMLHTFDENGNITGDIEPLAANFAGQQNKRKEMVRILAALTGCSFDSLWQRERRARTNRILVLAGVVVAAMAVFLGVVLSKNAQITDKNEQISAQNQTLERQMSTTLTDQGFSRLELHDVTGALQSAAEAFPEDGDLYDRRVEKLMSDALGAYRSEQIQSTMIDRQATEIRFAEGAPDGSCILTADGAGTVRCFDIRNRTERWSRWTLDTELTEQSNETQFFFPADSDTVLCKNTGNVLALSLTDGTVRWEYRYVSGDYMGKGNNFAALFPDGRRLALIDREGTGGTPDSLTVLDTQTGAVAGRTGLAEEGWDIELGANHSWYYGGGSFTDDGKYMIAAVYEREKRDDFTSGDLRIVFHIINTETWEDEHKAWITNLDPGSAQIVYGTHYIPEQQHLFCAIYNGVGIRTGIFCWADQTQELGFTNKTLRSDDGLTYNLKGAFHVQPMLADEKIALVFSDNTVFQFDRGTGTLLRAYEMKGTILNAWWVDRDEETVTFLTDNGTICTYDFADGTQGALDKYPDTADTDCTDLRFAFPAGKPDEVHFVLIPATAHEILETRKISDPDCETIAAPEFSGSDFTALGIPGGPSALLFCPAMDGTLTVIRMNLETGEETARQTYPLGNGASSMRLSRVPLDGERFIQGCTIFHLDGSSELLPGVEADKANEKWFHSVQLADGSVFTAEIAGESAGRCWLNGTPAEGNPGDAGISRMQPEGPLLITRESGQFGIYNVTTKAYTVMKDQRATVSRTLVAQGKETPVFACAYENGEILLYDPEKDAVTPLESQYERGEIRSAAFADGDRLMVILTTSGALGLYDLTGNRQIASVQPEFGTEISRLTRLQCMTDGEHHRLHILASQEIHNPGEWVCIDTEAWVITAQSDCICTWLSGNNSLYAAKDGRLLRFPVHSTEELRAWTEREPGVN